MADLQCECCDEVKPSVRLRACVYAADIDDNPHCMETVCDECEQGHAEDI